MMASKRGERAGKNWATTPALFTVGEAAKYLGVGRKKVYELIEWGELRAVKLGHAVQVEKDSLDIFRGSGKLT
jgi:excisionase family DNA binding protein